MKREEPNIWLAEIRLSQPASSSAEEVRCSTRLTIGEGDVNLVEYLTICEEHMIAWFKGLGRLDISEFARLKIQNGLTNLELAKHFKVGVSTVKRAMAKIRQLKNRSNFL